MMDDKTMYVYYKQRPVYMTMAGGPRLVYI